MSRLLLNEGRENETVVDAPAFSLTKILVVAAPVVTTVVGLLADKVDWFKLEMRAVHFTVLVVAVLGLIAVAGSADLIARALATAAVKSTESRSAALDNSPRLVRFANPFLAVRVKQGQDDFVRVAAATGEEPPRFLCLRKDGSLQLESANAMAGWNGCGLADLRA